MMYTVLQNGMIHLTDILTCLSENLVITDLLYVSDSVNSDQIVNGAVKNFAHNYVCLDFAIYLNSLHKQNRPSG